MRNGARAAGVRVVGAKGAQTARVSGGAAGAVGGVLAGMLARVADADKWRAWTRQVAHTGHCARPVRVTGGASAVDGRTGEIRAEWSSSGEPDGALLLACGDRREAVCPSCAETYRRDTWHLIAAGLAGRAPSLPGGVDAVPASVGTHPAVLATFTAPSFGMVHRATGEGPCRARSGPGECEHGARSWCDARHAAGDPLIGRPLCWDCYDYTAHVLWHAAVPELWRRTMIYLYRALARIGGERSGVPVSVRAVRSLVRVSYVKVAEYQRRGAVHLHAVIRLDGVADGDRSATVAPPGWADVTALADAIGDVAGRVAVPCPVPGVAAARWGAQLDVSPIVDAQRAAGYLAKYATKSASDTFAGLPPRRFGLRSVPAVSRKLANPHVGLLVAACFRLARRPECTGLRLADYAHTLGFRGHFASKSRWYSVTRGTLRAVRRAWRTRHRPEGDPWAEAERGDGGAVLVRDWRYLGTGWSRLGDADLAATLARDHVAARENADLAVTVRSG